jgi:hypothetical protein
MQCPLCTQEFRQNITEFDSCDEHLIISIKKDKVHVHGPFADQKIMNKMIKAMKDEMEKNGLNVDLFVKEKEPEPIPEAKEEKDPEKMDIDVPDAKKE